MTHVPLREGSWLDDVLMTGAQPTMELAAVEHLASRAPASAGERNWDRSDSGHHRPRYPVRKTPQLSIIVPVTGEEDAVLALLATLRTYCHPLAVEAIVVNAGENDWVEQVAERAQDIATSTYAVRVVSGCPESGRSGDYATAIQRGMAHARSPYVAVLDANLRYSPTQIVWLYQAALAHDADIAMATQHRADGSRHARGPDGRQKLIRRTGQSWAAKLLFPEHLWRVTDPVGSCFLFRRAIVDGLSLCPAGHNIALDVLVRTRWATLVEVPVNYHPASMRLSADVRSREFAAVRQFGSLIRAVPSAAYKWKIAVVWLLGGLISLAPFGYLLAHGQPIWMAWLAALETLLLCVAAGEDLNTSHTLRPVAIGKRLAVAHWSRLVPIGIHGAATLFLPRILDSHAAALAVATVTSFVVYSLLNPAPARHTVFRTNAASTTDETMLIGRAELAHQPISTLMTVSAILAGIVYISLAQLGPIVALAVLVLGGAFLLHYSIDRDKAITVVLALVTAIAALDYLTWRVMMTNWVAWFIAVPLLLAEVLGIIHTVGMQWTLWPSKTPRIRHAEDPTRRPIYIFIPTVNEGTGVLGPTLRALKKARAAYLAKHPYGWVNIVVCNDGLVANAPNWREPEILAQQLGVTCITRKTGGGAKAGNIENARQLVGATGRALVVIFDADQVAHPDFLLRTIKPFSDTEVGWVQTGQYYSNTDNPVARWANDQQALFYHLLCPGKAAHNAAFICGTNVMIRAAALDEIGGLPQDSVTEDFAASIQLHARWRSIYLSGVLAQGLGPMDLAAYFKQQRRWAIGTLSVLRTHWRLLLLPRKHGLRLTQRLQYILACTHYLSGIRDLIYIIAPLLYVDFGFPAVKGARLETFLWHFLPYWCASMSAFIYAAWKRTGWRGMVIGFASFPVLVGALMSVLIRHNGAFTVTSKRRANRVSLAVAMPHALAFVASVAALVWNWRTHNLLEGTAFFVQLWLIYITVMLSLSLWLAVQDTLYQRSWWHKLVSAYVRMLQPRPLARPRRAMARLSLASIVCLIALTAGSDGYVVKQQQPVTATTPASTITGRAPYVGIAGDTSLLAMHIPLLQSQAHAHFGIVGRTQNIAENFDLAWANELSSQDVYPWITLQFGRYEANGAPSLDASVTAIANGVHDGEILRVAREIRQFGKPVLVTILPNVDRFWSLSSAVANGGVPSDAGLAWKHVHTLFQEAGATNICWVWAPKDPAHDDAFAPPSALFDIVLVNATYNPAAISDKPQIIADVTAHHPDKPVLVEVTTVHPDRNESRWLQQMSGEVTSSHAIIGLVYFDGVPGEQHQRPAGSQTFFDMTLLRWAQQTIVAMAASSSPPVRESSRQEEHPR